MARYTVISNFKDRERGNRYKAGDSFPKGGRVSQKRIEELLNHPDHDGKAFIQVVEEEPKKEEKPEEETPAEEPAIDSEQDDIKE